MLAAMLWVLAAPHAGPAPESRFLKRACMHQSADQGLVIVSRYRDTNCMLSAAMSSAARQRNYFLLLSIDLCDNALSVTLQLSQGLTSRMLN